MKRRWHISGSAILAGIGVYRELWSEIPGTGQSMMGLLNAGYTRLEIARYFPSTALNWLAVATALGWAIYQGKNRKHAALVQP